MKREKAVAAADIPMVESTAEVRTLHAFGVRGARLMTGRQRLPCLVVHQIPFFSDVFISWVRVMPVAPPRVSWYRGSFPPGHTARRR